jgi:hypothetical protein
MRIAVTIVAMVLSASQAWNVARRPKPAWQARPSKSKPSQANPNKIAWSCLVLFVRIGTYQWVAAIPIKNVRIFSPLALHPIAKRASTGAPSFLTTATM